MMNKLAALPGVQSVALTGGEPMQDKFERSDFRCRS